MAFDSKAYNKAWREANKQRHAATTKAWYEANKEKVAAYSKAWRETNKEKLAVYYEANKERKRATTKAWREANKEKRQAYDKARGLRRKYGITPEQYSELLMKQSNKCAIPGCFNDSITEDKALAVDHDHITGRIRGLLCGPCNRLEGWLEKHDRKIRNIRKWRNSQAKLPEEELKNALYIPGYKYIPGTSGADTDNQED